MVKFSHFNTMNVVSLYLVTELKGVCYQSIMAYAFWQLFHKKRDFKKGHL